MSQRLSKYIKWSFISNTLISFESVISTHSMLSVVGHASTEAIASYNFIGKDILGQLGGAYIIKKFGSQIDTDTPKFVKKNMIIQQVSTFAECATPLLPFSAFLPVASISNVGKNICFASFGGVNAKMIQFLSEKNSNIGELYSTLCVVNTLASTLGMILGLILVAYVPSHSLRLVIVPVVGYLRYKSFQKSIEDFCFSFEKKF